MDRLDPICQGESFFHMVLAGCARHAENRERKGFRSVHLFFQSRWVACFGEGGHGNFDRRSVLSEAEACGAHPNLLNLQPASGGQSLADTANTGAAMHVVDPKREFRHFVFHICSMTTLIEKVQTQVIHGAIYGSNLQSMKRLHRAKPTELL